MLSKQACQVLATFIYSSLFNFPLTAKEVELRLLDGEKLASVGFEKFASVRLEKSESNYNSTHKEINKTVEIKKTVQQLAKQGYLFKKNLKQGDYYFPTKFMPQQLPQQLSQQIEPFLLREEKEGWAQLLRADLPALIVLAKRVPWIKGVAITGSLALNSGWKDDDIDLMVVAYKNRLWLTRAVVLIYSFFKGKKGFFKSGQDWCFNLWLEADALALSAKRQNLHTAYEVLQADWIYKKEGVEKEFLKSNSWVKKYIPNYFSAKFKQAKSDKAVNQDAKSCRLSGCFLDLINDFLFVVQSMYINAKLKIPRANLKKGQAFFHRKASGQEILIRLKRRLRVCLE